jgi:hypothetical protein
VFVWCVSLWVAAVCMAHTPLGGLTVAVSPDGKTIVAGGDTRALYIMDAATLEVKQRVWLKTSIYGMYFNNEGTKLLVEDTDQIVYFVNTQTWVVEKEQKNAGYVSCAMKTDVCAVLSASKEVSFISMTDATAKGKIVFDKDIAAFGISAEGTKLAVLSKEEKDDSEKTVASADIPKDLKGITRREFERRNDGKTSTLALFEVPSGKELSRTKTYYTTSAGATAFFAGNDVIIVNYSNEDIKLTAKGDGTMFELQNSYNYGIGVSCDYKWIGSGGLSNGTYTTIEGLNMKAFNIDKLPGWPEYFKGFAFGPDGTGYATTTSYRLVKIKPDGSVEKTVPVY